MTDPRPTEGSEAVAALAARHGAADLGRRIGVSEGTIRSWAKGRRKPQGIAQAQLEQHFGIAGAAFDRPAGVHGAGAVAASTPTPPGASDPSPEPVST